MANENSNLLVPLFLITSSGYWFYRSVLYGFFLSKHVYNFFDNINSDSIVKIIKFRKKFSLKTLKKFIQDAILKFFNNWWERVRKKLPLTYIAICLWIKLLIICSKKFKSISKFKYNWKLIKDFFLITAETFVVIVSLRNDIIFPPVSLTVFLTGQIIYQILVLLFYTLYIYF